MSHREAENASIESNEESDSCQGDTDRDHEKIILRKSNNLSSITSKSGEGGI